MKKIFLKKRFLSVWFISSNKISYTRIYKNTKICKSQTPLAIQITYNEKVKQNHLKIAFEISLKIL